MKSPPLRLLRTLLQRVQWRSPVWVRQWYLQIHDKEMTSAIISLGPHVKGVTCARQWVSNTLLFRKATHCQWWRQVSRCKRGLRHMQISLHSVNHLDPTSWHKGSTARSQSTAPSLPLWLIQNSDANLEPWIKQRTTHLVKMITAFKTIFKWLGLTNSEDPVTSYTEGWLIPLAGAL